MKRKKWGFTLIELMATLSILSIFMLLVSGAFIQNYKITVRTQSLESIQNQYRTMVLNIEKEIQSNENLKVIVYDDSKRCSMEVGVGNVISNIKPLIYIQRTVGSEKAMILYALVSDGTDNVFKEIQVQNIISGSIESSQSNITFSFKPSNSIDLIDSVDNITVGTKDNVINMNLEGITQNGQKRSYLVSFNIKDDDVINIDIGSGGTSEEGVIDDFISILGKHNVNIVGDGGQSIKATGNSKIEGGNGSFGVKNIHSQDIKDLEHLEVSMTRVSEESDLKNISFIDGSLSNDIRITMSLNTKPVIQGKPLIDKRINTDEAAIIFVNGNVELSGKLEITNTIIISTGEIKFAKGTIANITGSIFYSKAIDIDAQCKIKFDNVDGTAGNPKGILNNTTVYEEFKILLKNNIKVT